MALQKTINYKGITITDAYLKISHMTIDNIYKGVDYSVEIYATASTKPIFRNVLREHLEGVEGVSLSTAYADIKNKTAVAAAKPVEERSDLEQLYVDLFKDAVDV